MMVQVIHDFVLIQALTASFPIPLKWFPIVGSTAMYNKTTEIITFQMESKKSERLNKKQFAQILKLQSKGLFEEPMNKQVL